MADIVAHPEKYGAPTFEEFRKNPNKYMRGPEQSLTAVQNEGTIRNLVERHKYFFRSGSGISYECKTLEEVQKVAHSEGVPTSLLDYDPQVVPLGNGKCEMKITFYRKNMLST
jgi:hypothetical protein